MTEHWVENIILTRCCVQDEANSRIFTTFAIIALWNTVADCIDTIRAGMHNLHMAISAPW
jgi:hypothetical protein